MACAFYLDFDVPTIIRYLGGQYTGDDRYVSQILANITGTAPD